MVVTSAGWLARRHWWPAGLAWALWTLALLGLSVTPWLNQQARQAGRSDLGSDANAIVYGLVAVSAATVGAVLASRRPRHPVGWLLLAFGYGSSTAMPAGCCWPGRGCQPPLASRSWTPTSW
jgi:hypothetical protein